MSEQRSWTVAVIVPASNEFETVRACIESIVSSLDADSRVAASWIILVADSCDDGTVAVARAALGRRGEVVECSVASVGSARRVGCERAIGHFARAELRDIWIANTDADSTVAVDWVSWQLDWAEQGVAAIAGIVKLAHADELRPELANALMEDYETHPDGTHPHVHGANLGFRADAYLDAGGWSSLALAEDHCLWARVKARGWTMVSSIASAVTTSARLQGRATGGFANTLRLKVERMHA